MAKAKPVEIVIGKPKWKCPSCGRWTRNEIGRSCAKCAKVAKAAPPVEPLADPAILEAARTAKFPSL